MSGRWDTCLPNVNIERLSGFISLPLTCVLSGHEYLGGSYLAPEPTHPMKRTPASSRATHVSCFLRPSKQPHPMTRATAVGVAVGGGEEELTAFINHPPVESFSPAAINSEAGWANALSSPHGDAGLGCFLLFACVKLGLRLSKPNST